MQHLLPVILALLRDDVPDVRLNVLGNLDVVNQVRRRRTQLAQHKRRRRTVPRSRTGCGGGAAFSELAARGGGACSRPQLEGQACRHSARAIHGQPDGHRHGGREAGTAVCHVAAGAPVAARPVCCAALRGKATPLPPPSCAQDPVYSVREAASTNLARLARQFGGDWAASHALEQVRPSPSLPEPRRWINRAGV